MQSCIKFTGNDINEQNRIKFYQTFATFGEVLKIYINKQHQFGFIYYKDPIKVLQLIQQQPPFNYKYSLYICEEKKQLENLTNTSKNCDSNSNRETYLDDMDDISANASGTLYCIHGHEIPLLYDDAGIKYVPLDDLKCLGFKLFENPPNNVQKLDFDSELKHEFEIYMKQSAIKFLHRNRYMLDNEYIQNATAQATDLVFKKSSTNLTKNRDDFKLHKSNMPKSNYINKTRQTNLNHETNNVMKLDNTPSRNGKTNNLISANKETPLKITNDGNLRKPNSHSKNSPKSLSNNSSRQGNLNQSQDLAAQVPKTMFNAKDTKDECKSIINYVEPTLGSKEAVVVTHVEKDYFYVNLENRQSLMEDLHLNANLMACKAEQIKATLGSLVFAKYLDMWYRSIVLEVTPHVVVQYIDFGNISTEPINDVRQMTDELSSKPAEAIKITLNNKANVVLKEEMVINLNFSEKTDSGHYIAKYIPEKEAVITDNATIIRKCVTEIPVRNSRLSVIKTFDSTSFLAQITNDKCNDDLLCLKNMSADCAVDPKYTASITDLIAVRNKSNVWCRGIVLAVNSKPKIYKCALIDDGIIIESRDICKIHPKYKKLIVCICVVNVSQENLSNFKEGQNDIVCELLKEEKIIIHVNNKMIPATGTKWDPHKDVNTSKRLLPVKMTLEIGDIVKMINVDENKIYLRSKNSSDTFNNLNKMLQFNASRLSNPIVNQLVLHKCQKLFRRAIINDMKRNVVNLYYVDLGLEVTAVVDELYECTDDIIDIPCTVFVYDISNFKLDIHRMEIVNELKKLKDQKFNVIKKNGNLEFQFQESDKILLNHLRELVGEGAKVAMFDDMPKHEIQTGYYKLMCIYANDLDRGIVAFTAPRVEVESFTKLTNYISEYAKKMNKPHRPILNEVCLALYEDTWYRAVVKEINGSNYEVYYIDFGNYSSVNAVELRPVDDVIVAVPPVAILCEIDDFQSNVLTKPNYVNGLKKFFVEDTTIVLNILKEIDCCRFLISFNDNDDDDADGMNDDEEF